MAKKSKKPPKLSGTIAASYTKFKRFGAAFTVATAAVMAVAPYCIDFVLRGGGKPIAGVVTVWHRIEHDPKAADGIPVTGTVYVVSNPSLFAIEDVKLLFTVPGRGSVEKNLLPADWSLETETQSARQKVINASDQNTIFEVHPNEQKRLDKGAFVIFSLVFKGLPEKCKCKASCSCCDDPNGTEMQQLSKLETIVVDRNRVMQWQSGVFIVVILILALICWYWISDFVGKVQQYISDKRQMWMEKGATKVLNQVADANKPTAIRDEPHRPAPEEL
ncbi:MAG: hypothetical protein K8T25_09600 [Planctomycetia bacterium]|nr:hypothetical protein [Planctomycetia bacterium]